MRIVLFLLPLISQLVTAQSYYLFAGTYTNHGSKGIYVFRFNSATGKLDALSTAEGIVNPTYLEVSHDNKFIYAVQETGGKDPAYINAYSFDRTKEKLVFINKQPNGGDGPCYVTVSNNNKWVVVANFSGGSLTAFKTNTDGSLQPFSQSIQHQGKGLNPKRQDKSHVHSTVFSPDYKYIISPDFGVDKVYVYSFQPALKEPLQPVQTPFVETAPGSGPRHFTFHPNEHFAYLIEELSGNVLAYRYDNGKLSIIQTIAAHPEGYKGEIGSADIHISPDGRFLYASNRGDENTLTIYSIDTKTGKLMLKGFQPTLGKTPRNFIIEPAGNFLLVANQDSDNIVVFKRNQETGLLQETGEQAKLPNPVCLKLMR